MRYQSFFVRNCRRCGFFRCRCCGFFRCCGYSFFRYGFFRYGLTFRSVRDYCSRCLADIDAARNYWATGQRPPASPRLRPRRLGKWTKKLGDDDFRDGGRAQLLLGYGKYAVYPLITRITETDDELTREFAQRLIKTVLVREAHRIHGSRFSYAVGDHSADLVRWWEKEGSRFLASDDWTIPEGLLSPGGSEQPE